MQIIEKKLLRHQCIVNGQWIDASNGKTIEVYSPATGESLGFVPSLEMQQVEESIMFAADAFSGWRFLTAKERFLILRRWYDLIMMHQKDLATIMTAEQGKPMHESMGEIAYGASYIEWFAEEGKRIYGDTIPMAQPGKRIIVQKEPIGVCAAITPWNFPFAMIARKVAPALAAGCAMILKPAPQTPFSALAFAYLGHEAGLPPGVLNIVTGPAEEIGKVLTKSPVVRKLSFTGSTRVGKILMRDCAATVKKISLELGGHAPFIVFDDADIDEAVAGAIASKYRNSGQTCVCANRFLIQEKVYDEFSEKFVKAVCSELTVGNGFDRTVNQGPLIDSNALRKVKAQIEDAVAKGAKVACGGRQTGDIGFFFEPTVLLHANTDMLISHEETFGPVAPLFVFESEEEAITMANNSPYGLASYFYSQDVGRVWRVAEALEYGMVGINTGSMSSESAPFGGVKESGVGREGSKYGIEEYLEIKYICLGGLFR